MLQNPVLASQMVQMKNQIEDPGYQQKLSGLRDDPELKKVFDEIAAGGPDAVRRYWNDTELMSRISRKLGGVDVAPNKPHPQKARRRGPGYRLVHRLRSAPCPTSTTPLWHLARCALNRSIVADSGSSRHLCAQPGKIETIQEAARWNDLKRAKELIDARKGIADQDARGISPLGVAVGFNRIAIVKMLLDAGVDIDSRDQKGNTALHYAAGYGRKEIAQMLLKANADVNARNTDGQTPQDAAELNGENALVGLLKEFGGKSSPKFVN